MGKVSYSIHVFFLIIFRQNSWLNVSLRSGSFLVEALKRLYSFNTATALMLRPNLIGLTELEGS